MGDLGGHGVTVHGGIAYENAADGADEHVLENPVGRPDFHDVAEVPPVFLVVGREIARPPQEKGLRHTVLS